MRFQIFFGNYIWLLILMGNNVNIIIILVWTLLRNTVLSRKDTVLFTKTNVEIGFFSKIRAYLALMIEATPVVFLEKQHL